MPGNLLYTHFTTLYVPILDSIPSREKKTISKADIVKGKNITTAERYVLAVAILVAIVATGSTFPMIKIKAAKSPRTIAKPVAI
jgi:hypothetical protein